MPEPILIVDFDPPGLEATRACLRAAGMPSATAGSPRAFSLALRTTIPEIVVIEPVLPGLDGFRICEVLKKGVGGRVPIIVLASRQMAEEMFGARGRQAGADWILELPRDEPELVALCRDTIGPLPPLMDAPVRAPAVPALTVLPPRVARASTAAKVLEDLGEEDLDRILDNAFAGVAQAAAVDGPDVPALLAPRAPVAPAARPEPPIFDVRDAPGDRIRGTWMESSDRLFSDPGVSLDPRSTIPLARVPDLEPAAQPTSPDAAPRARPSPSATRGTSTPSSPRTGRSILRPLLLLMFTFGAGTAGYLTWEPEGAEPVARAASSREAAASGAAADDEAMDGAAADEDEADEAATHAADEAVVMPTSAPASAPVPTPAATTAAAPDPGPEQPVVAVLKPPIPPPIQEDGPDRSLPEPIAGTQLDPIYPAAARDAGLAGRVRMAVTVAPDGSVADVAVLEESEAGAGFGHAAAAAVRQWRFRPAVRNHEPHAATVEIALQFNP